MGSNFEMIFTDENGWYRGIKYFNNYVSQTELLQFKKSLSFRDVFLGELYEVDNCYPAIRVTISKEIEKKLRKYATQKELYWLIELADAIKFALKRHYYLTLIGV